MLELDARAPQGTGGSLSPVEKRTPTTRHGVGSKRSTRTTSSCRARCTSTLWWAPIARPVLAGGGATRHSRTRQGRDTAVRYVQTHGASGRSEVGSLLSPGTRRGVAAAPSALGGYCPRVGAPGAFGPPVRAAGLVRLDGGLGVVQEYARDDDGHSGEHGERRHGACDDGPEKAGDHLVGEG